MDMTNRFVIYEDVVNAVGKLKPGKCDSNLKVSSDHFQRACDELHVHLSLL